MKSFLPAGFYDLLYTPELQNRIGQEQLDSELIELEKHDLDEASLLKLSVQLSRNLIPVLEQHREKNVDISADSWKSLDDSLRAELMDVVEKNLPQVSPRTLRRIKESVASATIEPKRPEIPFSVSALLTGSDRTPELATQLKKELSTCERADWLVSFIKFSGVCKLIDVLRDFTATPVPGGGPRLRIATTSYLGATELKAIKMLLELPNTEVRVSYDTKRTRLHAKAYLFHRSTGFSSAYIGSANISKVALDEGMEWTVKVSEYETLHLWKHAEATFSSYWEDSKTFTQLTPDDLPKLKEALEREQKGKSQDDIDNTFFDLRPFPHQQIVLDEIRAERIDGKLKHLIIAATGTGKTLIAAFDYKAYCQQQNCRPNLLFIVHREEILKQALSAFRQVLRDGDFGELVTGNTSEPKGQHLFCTVQSWNSKGFDQFPPDLFEYVVLDEAHHASAQSYQRLIDTIKPKILLGLTATPERMDGKDIREDFGGSFTHQIRLADAINRQLLCPFHYYGIPDLDEIDLSRVAWRRGSYDENELCRLLEHNTKRAEWVCSEVDKHVNNMHDVRGLGFCVSIKHAEHMAEIFNRAGVASIALSSQSEKDQRLDAKKNLESGKCHFIFTVDLYNEGVDIPSVNMVLFLRPTKSLTVFIQQLGRGLRIHDNKTHLTVLDFISPQHRNFNYLPQFRAMSAFPNSNVVRQIENDMPNVPVGCFVSLSKLAKKRVLDNINTAISNMNLKRAFKQYAYNGEFKLQNVLDSFGLESPDAIYKIDTPSSLFCEEDASVYGQTNSSWFAKGLRALLQIDNLPLLRRMREILCHRSIDKAEDNDLILLYSIVFPDKLRQDLQSPHDAHKLLLGNPDMLRDVIQALDWKIEHTPPMVSAFDEKTGLQLHTVYTRKQIELLYEKSDFNQPARTREGVLHIPEKKLDLFFVQINKTESEFSPTTCYNDYAITEHLFHWQSQSTTNADSPTGRRYVHHAQAGYTPALLVRENEKSENGLTAPYTYLGPLEYLRHEGSRPMSITWLLHHPMPAGVFRWASRG